MLAAQLDFTARLLKKYGLCQRTHLFFGKSDRFRKFSTYQSVEIEGITVIALALFQLDKPLYFGIDRIFEIGKIAVAVGVGTKFRLVHLFGERF